MKISPRRRLFIWFHTLPLMNAAAASRTRPRGPTVVAMRPRALLAAAAIAAIATGTVVAACGTTGTPSAATAPVRTATRAPVYGPAAPDQACVAAKQAEQTLQSRQTKDQNNESALDQDFTNFASALNSDAQREKSPAAATAMTTLANDYTDLIESQSGAAQLPDMTQVQQDGAAFDKACS